MFSIAVSVSFSLSWTLVCHWLIISINKSDIKPTNICSKNSWRMLSNLGWIIAKFH